MSERELLRHLDRMDSERANSERSDQAVAAVAAEAGEYDGSTERLEELRSGDEPKWGARLALPAVIPAMEALPEDMIPEPLRPWLVDAAERVCVPLEYVAVPAIVGAGSIIGRSFGIRPKRHDDWTVIANVWGAIVGRPGLLKTPAVAEGIRPVRRLAKVASSAYEAATAARDAEKAILQARLGAVKDAAKRASKKGKRTELNAHQEDLEQLNREIAESDASERRYVTQDATPEKLGELLRANPRGLLCLRDELAGWLRSLDRPGSEGTREFFLESWNGTGSYSYDRIGRGTIHIPALTLSIFGGIQPGKLRGYIDSALALGAGDDGLLQRFQLLVYPDGPCDWRDVDRWPNAEARDRAFSIYQAIDDFDPLERGADSGTYDEIPTFRFAPEAQELFSAYRDGLERELRLPSADDTPAFTAHIAKFRSLVPALALIFHAIDLVDHNLRGPVSLEATRLAARWEAFLRLNAEKVYSAELHGDVLAAARLGEQAKAGSLTDGMTVRDVYRREWAGLANADLVRDGLKVLERHGWAAVRVIQTPGGPSEVVRLHPDLRRAA